MGDGMSVSIERFELESKEKWRDWVNKIPFIKFNHDWQVKVIPPFAGVCARFFVKKGDKQVSVYLDVNDSLGFVGNPYWEVYPIGDDASRFLLGEEDEMLKAIEEQLSHEPT